MKSLQRVAEERNGKQKELRHLKKGVASERPLGIENFICPSRGEYQGQEAGVGG